MANDRKSIRKWLIPEAPRPGQWKRWLLTRLATLFVTFSILLLGGGLIFKNRLIFYPGSDAIDSPANYGLRIDEFQLELADGSKIRAWLAPAPPAAPAGDPDSAAARIVLLFQGNAGNVSMMTSRLAVLNSLGLAALTVDYPGYGPNEGSPSEANVYQSAEAAWQWAVQNGYRPEDIVIFGYSLGGGVASYLAERHPPAGLILDSTFTRLRDVPSQELPLLAPYFQLVLGDDFDSQARLERIRSPLLILHSPDDEVVPFSLGRELFQSYRNNYKDMAVGRGGHTDFYLNRDLYRERISAFLSVIWPD